MVYLVKNSKYGITCLQILRNNCSFKFPWVEVFSYEFSKEALFLFAIRDVLLIWKSEKK